MSGRDGIKASLRIEGLEDLREVLREVAPNEANNLLRATVHGVAGDARDRMQARVAKRTGTKAKAIRAERRRGEKNMPVSDVVVTHGKGVPYDAFYWHFGEFGTVNEPARPAIVPTIEEVRGEMPETMRREFGEKYEKLLARRRKKAGKK